MKATVIPRAQRIAQWLTNRGKPASAEQVYRGLSRSVELQAVRVTIAQLIKHGKVDRATIGRGNTTYIATPAALQDGRLVKADRPKKRKVNNPAPFKPVASRPAARNKSAHTAFLLTPNSIHHQVTNAHGGAYMAAKRLESIQIAKDLALFEKTGGKVQRLGMHECSRPLNHDYRDAHTKASTMRGGLAARNLLKQQPSPVVVDADEATVSDE